MLQDRDKTFICDTVTRKSRTEGTRCSDFQFLLLGLQKALGLLFIFSVPQYPSCPSTSQLSFRGRIKTGKNHSCVQDFTDNKLGRRIIHQFKGEALCSPVLLPEDRHSESCSCSSSCPNSSFKRQIRRESMTHQNGKCAWFPISLLETLQSSVILMALTFFNWRKLRASPILSGSSLHWDMRTFRGWKTFKWLP